MLWVKLLGRNGLRSLSLPCRAPGGTGEAGGVTSKMVSYSFAWCLGAPWCRSLSMCRLSFQGFSTCPGHIKTGYYLFFHWAGSQEVGPGQIRAMLGSGTVSFCWILLVKADMGFIDIRGTGRTDSAFWWGCGKATLQKNTLQGKYCCIQFEKHIVPQTI